MKWIKENWFVVCTCFVIYLAFFLPSNSQAYGECSDYGIWATYDYLSGNCKCMSGYVFGKDIFGETTCVYGNTVCHDKYGYNSRYNSTSNSCECSYGYLFGKDSIGRTQCISEDQSCKDQYGYNARSTYGGKCECSYGYVISGGKCTNGDILCRSRHGLYSSYNDSGNTCECDSGYTLNDSSQCVKKQNNVYFTLKELDTDARKAIIKSDYDYRYYLISYNSGCYSSSFRRYLNQRIVLNLGTDFDLDKWDKIVLQDDNETCDITSRERVDSNFSFKEEDDIYVPVYMPTPYSTPQSTKILIPKLQPTPMPTLKVNLKCDIGHMLYKNKCIKIPTNSHPANDGKNAWLCDEGYIEKGNLCFLDASASTTLTPTPTPTATPKVNKSFWNKLKFW